MKTQYRVTTHRPRRRSSARPYQPLGCVRVGIEASPELAVDITATPVLVVAMVASCQSASGLDQGDDVRLDGTFADDTGSYDPDAVVFVVRDPVGVETSYEYATDPAVQRVTQGAYRLTFRATLGGRYVGRLEGSGAKTGVAELAFTVEQSKLSGS